jgi:hypothetical protein
LFQFNANPVRTDVADLYEVVEEPCALYIRTQKGGPPLDTLVPPGRNHLFYLEKEEGDSGYLLLFLQELDCKYFSPRKSFKLLLCCAYADIFLLSPPTISSKGIMFTDIRDTNLQLNLHSVISEARKMIGGKEVLEGSLRNALGDRFDNLDGRGMRQMFPETRISLREVLHVIQGCLNESRHQKPNFAEAYARCINENLPRCDIKLTIDYDDDDSNESGWIKLILTPRDWAYYKDYYRRVGHSHSNEIMWEWCYTSEGKSWFGKQWKSCAAERWGPWRYESVSVRARIKSFVESLQNTQFYWWLRRLSFTVAAAETSEDEATILTREPRWEDHFIPCREWPQELIDSFAADGETWQVWIL